MVFYESKKNTFFLIMVYYESKKNTFFLLWFIMKVRTSVGGGSDCQFCQMNAIETLTIANIL